MNYTQRLRLLEEKVKRIQEIRAGEIVDVSQLTPFVRAMLQGDDGEILHINGWAVRMFQQVEVMSNTWDMALPTPEEIRHNRRVAHLITKQTGRSPSILGPRPSAEERERTRRRS